MIPPSGSTNKASKGGVDPSHVHVLSRATATLHCRPTLHGRLRQAHPGCLVLRDTCRTHQAQLGRQHVPGSLTSTPHRSHPPQSCSWDWGVAPAPPWQRQQRQSLHPHRSGGRTPGKRPGVPRSAGSETNKTSWWSVVWTWCGGGGLAPSPKYGWHTCSPGQHLCKTCTIGQSIQEGGVRGQEAWKGADRELQNSS